MRDSLPLRRLRRGGRLPLRSGHLCAAWIAMAALVGGAEPEARGAPARAAAPATAPRAASPAAPRPASSAASAASAAPATAMVREVAIEDPGHKGLARFHARVECVKARAAGGPGEDSLVRVAHYGDSIIAADRFPSGVRRALQQALGDGGHGFLLVKPPNRWYHRAGALQWGGRYWSLASIQSPWMAGVRYGYGGALARSYATGAAVHIRPRREGSVGGRVSRLVVLFEKDPQGGFLSVTRAGVELGRVSTRGPRRTSGRELLRFPEGTGDIVVTLGGGGVARVHGFALEREGPGIVWDGLGLTGARYYTLARLPDAHFQEQLRLRPADLVVFQYGANISDLRTLPEEWYRQGMRKVLARLAPLRSRLSCLVVGPVDRGFHWRFGWPSRPIVKHIERVQREEALAHGCAFWAAREAMGGEGSAGRWARAKPPLIWGDLTHLRPAGARRLGRALGQALLVAHDGWRRAHPGAACPGPTAPARPGARP